jgi:hypothetical protein
VGTFFDELAFGEDEDLVGVADGGEALEGFVAEGGGGLFCRARGRIAGVVAISKSRFLSAQLRFGATQRDSPAAGSSPQTKYLRLFVWRVRGISGANRETNPLLIR